MVKNKVAGTHYTHAYVCVCVSARARECERERERESGVVVNILDYYVGVSKYKLLSCYYFHFRFNTLHIEMNILILPSLV